MRAAMAQAVFGQLVDGSPVVTSTVLLITLFPVLFMLVVVYVSSGPGGGQEKRRLPPSPPAMPLIGHVHLVGALPHVSLRGLASRHGDLMLLRLGAVPTLVASSKRAAEAVLRVHDQSLASRPRSVFSDVLLYGPSEVAFQPYGERWRQAKKLVTTHLLSARKVQLYRTAREEEVGLVIDKIHGAAAAGEAVDLSTIMTKFTNDVICRAVAGRSFRVEGRDRVFRDLIDQAFAVLGGFNLESFYPGLAKVAGGMLVRPARHKAERIRAGWDELLDKLMDEHAIEVAASGAPAGHEDRDFIHVLLSLQEEYGLTRDSIKGILFNMFAAGTDTVYLVLEFAMAELMLHPDVMAKLQSETRKSIPKGQKVVSEDNLAKMTYLKAVIKETLRLHPPSPLLLPHLSLEDCNVDGYTIPSGTTVMVNAWAIGRDTRVWDAAEEFKPERFINMGEIGGADFRGLDFQFLPFGSGRRICPGINFALAAIEIMLANLVYHFDWELPKGVNTLDMTEIFGLTVSRKVKLILAPKVK